MATRNPRRWSAAELALIREHYPSGGVAACRPWLPGRSDKAIYLCAFRLGPRRPPARSNAQAPRLRLQGRQLEEALHLREEQGWSYKRIGARFGIGETSASNAILITQCRRQGFTPAERDSKGCLTDRGLERVRYALKKGLKGVDIQLRLGVSAACVAEQRRRYNADLHSRGKAPLPPVGAGQAYSGARLPHHRKVEVETLFLQGLGTQKIHEQTGVSHTSITRIRTRLVRRLKRKGQALPGCDRDGVRHVQKESARFVPQECIAVFRQLLLDRVPVRRAAQLSVIGGSSAYRLRDAFVAELAEQGETLPSPILPGRVRNTHQPRDPHWPPVGTEQIYRFRELLNGRTFEEARAEWRGRSHDIRQAEAKRPRNFEEQLERVARGEIGIVTALPRHHLAAALPMEQRPS